MRWTGKNWSDPATGMAGVAAGSMAVIRPFLSRGIVAVRPAKPPKSEDVFDLGSVS